MFYWNIISRPVFLSQLLLSICLSFVAVTLVCPPNETIPTPAGNKAAQVTWKEPELTGWDKTNFTSSSVPGDTFSIGSHNVTYKQWFGINNLVLTCSFGVVVIGEWHLWAEIFWNRCGISFQNESSRVTIKWNASFSYFSIEREEKKITIAVPTKSSEQLIIFENVMNTSRSVTLAYDVDLS